MINNDVLRRLRYAFDFNDSKMIELFELGGVKIDSAELLDLLKREDQEGFLDLENRLLDGFLTGLITHRRGPPEPRSGPPPPAPPFTNNTILRKLRIALNFKDDDMLATLALAGFRISKGELSAFFRQHGHKNYRECGDQIVRNFLQGLALHLRPPS